LLKEYWGPDAQFRSLKVYKNPDHSSDIIEISQALIVETIIAEYNNSVNKLSSRDLFLTAPTGSGKSLLFQLPSFYVSANGDITIVVSPLIALMKDQVNAIISERKFEKVAYLNSELSLVDREKIIEKCHSGVVDLIYMSPELLMSYDISHFIGERKLGLVVIDEAHLITTWGRDFRVDYWFLGNHIRKIRKYHNMSFPLVAVTATAIYGGANDMVFDSIDSLVMRNPHMYIGQVKREDVNFAINNHEKFEKNYENSKLIQTINFIKGIHKTGLKTLVYAPYTKHIRQILEALRSENLDFAAGYYGSLPAEQKELSFREFKSGYKKIMIATKAFGMGVDISDIEVVYHHAPSGLLPDYVQEIGRVAREPEITGYAALNYTSQDQRFTKALHGMSALRQYQLKDVLKKIHKTYLKNKKSRNLLLSIDDFAHIFENTLDLDQKVLTALMMIEKDYLAKSRFNVIVARPKKLFVKVFARVTDEGYINYNKLYPNTSNVLFSQKNGQKVIEVSLDDLWYNNFSDKSFPVVKHDFYSGYLFRSQNIEVVPQLKISFERTSDYSKLNSSLNSLFEHLKAIFVEYDGKYFNEKQFYESINSYLDNQSHSEKIGQFILSSYSGRLIQPGVIESDAFLQSRRDAYGYKYRVFNNKYLSSFASLINRLKNLFGDSSEVVATRFVTNKASNSVNYVRFGYFLEMLELGTFEIKGGENPMVFVRINDPKRIEKDATSKFYLNTLLSKTLDRHYLSNQIFDHFFLRSFSNSDRWNFIEDFFLGMDIDILLDKYKGGGSNNLNVIEYLEKNVKAMRSPVTQDEARTNIHIFHPKKEQYYKTADLLTMEDDKGFQTKTISRWLSDDPELFDFTRKKHDLKIDKTVFELLVSKLRTNHLEYFKKSLGLDMRIKFKGYPALVKAIVPYKDQPVSFYKWWIENPNELYMDFKSKIELINKVHGLNPSVLKSEHKKTINI
jgi:RecQ family ATP-dependent DNA helicase